MSKVFKIFAVFGVLSMCFTLTSYAGNSVVSDPTNPIMPGIVINPDIGGGTSYSDPDCTEAGIYEVCSGAPTFNGLKICDLGWYCSTCTAGYYCPATCLSINSAGLVTAYAAPCEERLKCPTAYPNSASGAKTESSCYATFTFYTDNGTTVSSTQKVYYKTNSQNYTSSNNSYYTIQKIPTCTNKTGYTCKYVINSGNKTGSVGDVVTTSTQWAGNASAKRNYTANTYTIKFNANGGTGTMDDLSMTYDKEKTLPAKDFTRTGYTFLGWGKNTTTTVKYADKASVNNLTSTSNGTVRLYAIWEANQHTILYNCGSGSGNAPASQTVSYGSKFSTQINTCDAPTGYHFVNWLIQPLNVSNNMIARENEQITWDLDRDAVITARYEPNIYTIYFHPNDGTDDTDTTTQQFMIYGSSTNLAKNTLSRNGYSFKNWCTTPNCGSGSQTYNDQADGSTFVTKNEGEVHLYAQWEPDKVTIELNYNGGTGEQDELYTIFKDGVYLDEDRTRKMTTSENPITVPAGPSKTIAYDKNTDDHVTISGDYTTWFKQTFDGFYSIIDNEAYTLINSGGFIESDGISLGTSYTSSDNPEWGALYGRTTVTLPTNVTRTGYTFNGWCTTQACDTAHGATLYNDGTAQLSDNTTLWAQWEPITYTIIFNKNNIDASGEIGDMTDVKYNEPVTLPTSGFTLDGFFLSGWCTTSTCSGDDNTTYTLGYSVKNLLSEALTITLYAKWTTTQGCWAGQYFDATDNECKDCPDGSYCKGCDAENPADGCGKADCPPGYTSDANAEDVSDCYATGTISCAEANPLANTTGVQPGWSYNATENVPCKKWCEWDNTECNANAKCLPDDTTACNVDTDTFACQDGYSANITNAASPTCDIVTNHIIYHLDGGKLSGSVQYTFDSTNGTATQDYNVESGDITLPTSQHVTKKGYTFGGWYDNASLTGDIVASVPHGSYSNKDFYAKWTATPYTITYNTNDGTCAECSNSAYTSYTIESSDVTLPTNLTKDGYTFVGWKDNNGNTVTKVAHGSTGNKEFTAVWNPNGYILTFKCDDAVTHQLSVTFGKSFTMRDSDEICARTGYSTEDNFTCKKDSDNTEVTLNSGLWNIVSDVTCSANRTANEYTVDYYCGENYKISTTGTFNESYVLQNINICAEPGFTPSEQWSCIDPTTSDPVELSGPTWLYPNNVVCINDLVHNVALCPAGTYLPSGHDSISDCEICESDSFCPGYEYYGISGFALSDEDQGIESCPDGKRSPAGTKSFWDCGYIMHVNGDELYLSQKKRSGKPALAVKWGDNTAYATMSPVPSDNKSLAKPITKGSNVKLHIKYKGIEYTAHDNTVE